MTTHKDLYIRKAHLDEIISILSEHQIASKLSKPVLDCLGSEHNYTLIVYKGYRLLVSYKHVGKKADGLVEVHIACPRDSIVASRVLAMIGMKWLVEDAGAAAKQLITYAPLGKIGNFLLRIGFKRDETREPRADLVFFTYDY